jgi:hypothetical protein
MSYNDFRVSLPTGKSGNFRIETFTVSQEDSDRTRLRAMMGRGEMVPAGTYTGLWEGSQIWMSDTPMEIRSNYRAVSKMREAKTVLISGLGLGMIVSAALRLGHTIEKMVVLELNPDVVELVGKPLMARHPELLVVQADALTYKPGKGEAYDVVYHDIWPDICSDNLKTMTQLTRKWCRRAGWQDCWMKLECQRARAQWGW